MTQAAAYPFPAARQEPGMAPWLRQRPARRREQAPAPSALPRLLPTHGVFPGDLDSHLARHGPLPRRPGPGLIAEIEAAGLTGRGGAAFPTHRKLAAVAEAGGSGVVIANGAEGEPASSKDKSLLWMSPHLVLDGLQLAAHAVGSRAVGLYVHRNPRLLRHLSQAIAERSRMGIDRAAVELVEAPARFLAGEESALSSRVGGGPTLPRFKPPRVSQRGVAGRPTLVQNVETLAHLALIARYGAAWFRSVGLAAEPGSMLATVHHPAGRTSVVEVPIGAPLASLLGLASAAGQPEPGAVIPALPWPGAAGGSGGPVQAVLVGGYHGAWLPAGQAATLSMSNASLRPLGAAVGAGVVAALPADRCGLAETARVVAYLALESAGQCGPCFNGLPRIAAAFEELADPRPTAAARSALERWARLVQGRGACHHPDGSVRLVRSALRVFAAEIDRHASGRCAAVNRDPFLPLPLGPALDEADWK